MTLSPMFVTFPVTSEVLYSTGCILRPESDDPEEFNNPFCFLLTVSYCYYLQEKQGYVSPSCSFS